MRRALEVPGVLTAGQIAAIGDFIAANQDADGAIPWFRGGQLDPWDHVEAAMGLAVVGRYDEAIAAFEWSARTQRADGSWPMEQVRGEIREAAADTNQCAYLATGAWHFYLITGEVAALARLWPTVEAAIDFVVSGQLPSGALAWAKSANGSWDSTALLTGSSSALQSIECACLIAQRLGHVRPHWQESGRRLHDVFSTNPGAFADRSRYSMDWYYPILTGAIRGPQARQRIDAGWDRYYWPGHGVRCVDDEPWVTAAETVELVAALDAMGDHQRALQVFDDMHFLLDEGTGGYWTGKNLPNDQVWPVEQTTWSAGAVLLAADALTQTTGGAALFRDAGSWPVWERTSEGVAG